MVVYLVAYPESYGDEVATFIYNETGSVYTRQDIAARLDDLCMTRKVASTEAYQAHEPHNLMKFHLFWTMPPPLGVVGIPRRRFIDVDEFQVSLQKTNRKRGHAHMSIRIRKPGNYQKAAGFSVLYAIEPGDPSLPADQLGSIERPRKWIQVNRNLNTDQFVFADFIDTICADFENHTIPELDNHRVFLWDNLSAHMTAHVYQTVEGRGHPNFRFQIVRRPPYQPKIAPIEYKICDVCLALQKLMDKGHTMDDLEHLILQIVATVGDDGNYQMTFDHCGYTEDGQYPPNGYDP
jgi:hypothetical protein